MVPVERMEVWEVTREGICGWERKVVVERAEAREALLVTAEGSRVVPVVH